MVVNLWYSTCPPCARELADFAAVDAEVGDDVRFVGVNPYDTATTMTRFAADRGVTLRAAPRSRLRARRRARRRRLPGDAVRRRRRADRRRAPARSTTASCGSASPEHWSRVNARPVVPAGHGRRRQPVRLRAAADVPHVLPRPRGRRGTIRSGRRCAGRCSCRPSVSAGFMAVFVVVGGDQHVVHVVDRRATPSTSPVSSASCSSCSASPCCSATSCRSPRRRSTSATRDRTVRSMFVYGIAYAVVSLELHDRAVHPDDVRHRRARRCRRRRRSTAAPSRSAWGCSSPR